MHLLFLMVLHFTISCVSTDICKQDNPKVLMSNVLVLSVPYGRNTKEYVCLTCGEAHQTKLVFWKKNGLELNPALVGNNITVLVEEMNGGNYTCHDSTDREYLNHTVIMVQQYKDNSIDGDYKEYWILEKQSPEEVYIQCSAPNYQGSFQCTWKKTRSRSHAAVLLVNAKRDLEYIPCELNADGSGIHCHHANCQSEEEKHRIELTVYMYSHSRLELYATKFFLRQIVRPDKIPNLRSDNGNMFTWSYPDSWEKPCSYFRLEFQVKVVHNRQSCDSEDSILHATTEETKHMIGIKANKYIFCVRAKDKYTDGPFSPWSHCMVKKPHLTCQLEP
ncbi:interleukin-12 subunit beta [Antennarius striatus]|uniref:interleukin-12 subunit beta n=1 Tax=Antennarius striatus TaxID=241820 RepID=UPI0035B3CDD7